MEGTETEGLILQRTLSELCSRKMTPLIGRVLDAVSSPDLHVCIERLEIDVGAINHERLEQDLAEKIGQSLERQIKKQISNQIHHPVKTTRPPISGNIRYLTAQDSINQALIHFLTTGSLLWSFSLPAGQGLEQSLLEAWQEAADSGSPPLNSSDFIPGLLASETVRKRVVRQFSTRFLMTFLALIAPDARVVLDEILQRLHATALPFAETKQFEAFLLETLLEEISSGKTVTATAVVKQAWSALPAAVKERHELVNLLEREWPGITNRPATSDASGAALAESDEIISPSSASLQAAVRKKSGSSPQSITPPLEDGATGKGSLDPIRHPEAEEGIYIGNAGLVLMHPFLPRFFTALGVASDDRLLRPGRALCLLHYLATGQTIAPEYELVLPKILCNLPLDAAAESDVSLTDAELEEAAALLQAVIHHWEALRSTSADGLRGTFLLRPGKVSLRNNDWLLQVESKSFDILLDQLPWGISMIKLPWMERLLWVEWNREC